MQAFRYACITKVRIPSNIRLVTDWLLVDPASNAIQELCFRNGWLKGAQLPVALRGSKLAVALPRVFYQSEDLSLKECVWSAARREWHEGQSVALNLRI